MSSHREGQRVREVAFELRRGDAREERSSAELFGGKRVVAFALPRAFTPTCSSAHLPRLEELADRLRAKGVDAIHCLDTTPQVFIDGEHIGGADELTAHPESTGAAPAAAPKLS